MTSVSKRTHVPLDISLVIIEEERFMIGPFEEKKVKTSQFEGQIMIYKKEGLKQNHTIYGNLHGIL